MLGTSAPPRTAPRPGRRRAGLLYRYEARTLLRIAGPIVLSQLGTVGMNTVDTIMVAPLGPESLAAAGLASSLHMAAIMVSTGVILGMAPLVSHAFGAGDRATCRHVLMQGIWLSLMLSIPMIGLNLIGEPFALALDQDPIVADLIGGYMRALAWGVVPLLLFMAARQFLEGMSLTRPAMVITFIGLAVNVVGNRVLIYGIDGLVPAYGVIGAGYATTVVRWSMLISMVIYITRNPDLHPFRGVRLSLDGRMLGRIAWIGAPTGMQVGMEVGVFTFAAVMMGWFGAIELGTHQIAMNIASTTFMIALGVSLAGSIRVGQQIGAGDDRGVRRSVVLTYFFAVGSMAVAAIVFFTIPQSIIGIYTRDPRIMALGVNFLYAAAAFQVFDGAQVAGFALLRGAADTRVPMLIAGFAYWVIGAPTAYFLAFHTTIGPFGVWIGLSIGLAIAGVLLLGRVRRVLM